MNVTEPALYAYLLGTYLGDGHVVAPSRKASPYLVISCDDTYPEVAEEIARAMRLVFPGRRVTRRRPGGGRCVTLRVSFPTLLQLFPQHGPGKKHDRPIVLEPWQRSILDRHPEQFLRGLLHSDGCRTVNRFSTRLPSGRIAGYAYVRYFFSNRSADIRALFCEYCDRLGIRWTQSNPRNISVAHRQSVARLESFVGVKT